MKVEARRNSVCGRCDDRGEEDVSGTAIATELSAGIVDVFSGEVVNAADFGCAAAPAVTAQPDPPERAMGRRWLAAAATALVTAAYAPQVVVLGAETSPAPIAGIAPSYGPKTVSAVPNAAAIERRIWLPQLDAGYDPQGLAVNDGAVYVSAYRSDSLGVRRGPCRVIRIDAETGGSTGYVDVPSPCGHAGGLAFGGDGMLYVADTHTLFATPLARAFDRGARFRQFSLGPGFAVWIGRPMRVPMMLVVNMQVLVKERFVHMLVLTTAPFIGAAIAVPLLGELITWPLIAAAALMAAGVYLHLAEKRMGGTPRPRSRPGASKNGTRALDRAVRRVGARRGYRIERFGPLRQAFALPRGGCRPRVFRSVYSVDIPYQAGTR